MCGRYSLTVDSSAIQELFPFLRIPPGMQPRFNIAPSQPVAVVPNDGKQQLDFYKWGLVPSWAKDPEIGNRLINARAETLAEKPSFRNAFRYHRCLVLADGFYEWTKINGGKIPMYFHLTTQKPFAFAGLWDLWHAPDGSELFSCTIITTQPNALIEKYHNRMPVILTPEHLEKWLNPEPGDAVQLSECLFPYPAELMKAYPVSRLVNNPATDSPECILPGSM
ncbi:MAG: SOS response-associated peptidase [Anaerolineales bacterium]|nr:SOS response-associated peptidase [Anaerolineales bacterium]